MNSSIGTSLFFLTACLAACSSSSDAGSSGGPSPSATATGTSDASMPPPMTTGTPDGSMPPPMTTGAPDASKPSPTGDACLANNTTTGLQKLNCEGLDFDLTVPDTCKTTSCGLIADVHGFAMNDDLMELHTHMQELGGAKGYIVLQPSAPGKVGSAAWSPTNDAQVWALMQDVIKAWHVDPKRIHFDGYSMGAWMTWRMVCAHSDVLASAAPISGGLQPGASCAFSSAQKPAQQIPVLYTHGRNDGLVNFSQATAMVNAVTSAWFPGVTPQVVAKDFDYEWDRYTNSDGTTFEFVQHDWECGFKLVTIQLKGHCFPGSNQFLGCGRDTNGAADGGLVYPFKWAETVLQFFVDHPRKN